MRVSWFVEPVRLRLILGSMLAMLRLFAGICLVPLLMSLLAGEFFYSIIFAAMSLATFLASLIPTGQRDMQSLKVHEALAVTALVYLLFSLIGGLAFLPVSSFLDGFFEAVSGFTTTGLSVMDVEHLPQTLLFFRSYSQWIGGAGIVILSLVVLAGPSQSAFHLYASEFGQENLAGDVRATARIVVRSYLALTLFGFLLLVLAGMSVFDGLLSVMSSVSTGGFSAHSDSIGHYASPFIRVSVILLTVLGAIGFPSYYLLLRKEWVRFLHDLQVQYLLFFLVVSTIFALGVRGWDPSSFLSDLFNCSTAITTTGFSVTDTASLPEQIRLLDVMLMVVGGCTGSTAGGIKLFRLVIMVLVMKWVIVRILLPVEAKLPIKYGDRVVEDREVKQVFAFLAVYGFILSVSTLFFVVYGFSIADSLFECASALGTVGLSAGVTSPDLSAGAKLVLILNMWAGRLEILPALLLFLPPLWRPRRGTK